MKTLTIIALGLLIVGYVNQKNHSHKSSQDYFGPGNHSYYPKHQSEFDAKFEIEKARLMYDFSEFQE